MKKTLFIISLLILCLSCQKTTVEEIYKSKKYIALEKNFKDVLKIKNFSNEKFHLYAHKFSAIHCSDNKTKIVVTYIAPKFKTSQLYLSNIDKLLKSKNKIIECMPIRLLVL